MSVFDSGPEQRDTRLLVFVLLALGTIITAGVIPAIFTVDENNYLINVVALRSGHVTVPNPAHLNPSRELLFFDPGPWERSVESTPMSSTAPPLYALLALPFSLIGWRGLVALNTIAFVATAALVFVYTGRFALHRSTAWLGAATFAFGGCAVEYALGLWPHSLSVALCFAGIVAAGHHLETQRTSSAALAGFLLALATGVRYQNAVALAAVAAGFAAFATHRWRSTMAFGVAAALPLAMSAAINCVRLASWNPISKGPGYLTIPLASDSHVSWTDPLLALWARVVDYSALPILTGRNFQGWLMHDSATGAHLIFGVGLKKAFLQSAPLAAIGFLFLFLGSMGLFAMPPERRRQVRLLSFVTLAILAAFSFSGVSRDDGLSFNQRYLLELLPIMATAVAWALEGVGVRVRSMLLGAVIGAAAALILLVATPMSANVDPARWTLRLTALLDVPLFLAVLVSALWLSARVRLSRRTMLGGLAGVCLGWALAVHLAHDVLIEQSFRRYNFDRSQSLASALPPGSGLLAYWSEIDPAGALLLRGDFILLNLVADDAADAPRLTRDLLRKNRRVFLIDEGLPPAVRTKVLDGMQMVVVDDSRLRLVELTERSN